MHDIDRVQPAAEEFEAEAGEFREPGELELGGPEPPMHEAQELEFASRLLELSNEQELERFLGDVFHAAGSAIGRFARSDTGRALGGILTDAVGRVLPLKGGAGGGVPGLAAGHGAGGDLAQQAAALLGLELEGLSPPEQEFETARQVVRLTGNAYRHAAWAPQNVPPRAAARMAATRAAQRYAPGLLRWAGRTGSRYGGNSWPGTRYSSSYGYRPAASHAYRPAASYAYRPAASYAYRPAASYAYRPAAGGYLQADGYQRRDPWRSRRTYRRPQYAWSYGPLPYDTGDDAGGYGPDSYALAAVPEPPVAAAPVADTPAAPADSVPVPIPPPATAVSPADPAPESGSSGELGPFGPPGERPGPRRAGSRVGRWERHGSVLIVYGI